MDYFGEPAGQPLHAWPHVSCDFGQFDISGHPKPHAYWYQANWLQGFDKSEPGRPSLPYKTVARILELPGSGATRYSAAEEAESTTINAVTTAPFGELFLDGVTQGVLPSPRNERGEIQSTHWPYSPDNDVGACTGVSSFPIDASGVQCHGLQRASEGDASDAACASACCDQGARCDTWQRETVDNLCWIGAANEGVGKCGKPKQGTWDGGQRTAAPAPSPVSPYRNATLVAYSADPTKGAHSVLATHTLFAPTANTSGYKLQLTLDVPSATTGTGGSLLLDGRDTAFVRCSIVDHQANNALVADASDRITWRVVSGPGRVTGISNGNTSSHEWMKSHHVNAYLGLARGIFRVTKDCTSSERASCATIDVDAGRSPTVVQASGCVAQPIVIEARAEGFAPATISIPTSVDVEKDGVMAVARATGGEFRNGFSYLDEFVG